MNGGSAEALEQAWSAVEDELSRVAEDGATIKIWLRDDDAIALTPALERLRRLCEAVAMPVLLAVIPAPVTSDLGAWIEDHPAFTPCQHGYAHANHAEEGARAFELGGARSIDAVESELRRGRARLKTLFGDRLSDCLVPPWNRIDPALIPGLPALGFDRLSTFGPPEPEEGGIRRLNADLDIIDWRHGRAGRSFDDVARKLAELIAASRQSGRPIGLLTHHLAHDERAWDVLEEMLTRLGADRRVAFAAAADLA